MKRAMHLWDQCHKIRGNNITEQRQGKPFGTQWHTVIFHKALYLIDQIWEKSFISISAMEIFTDQTQLTYISREVES